MCICISIIVPLYNKEKCIRNTIKSVLNQTYGSFELLVIDDGSTDNSAKVISEFTDTRIKYYYKGNGGVSSARNYGIGKSSNEWIMFLDADDTLEPDCLSTLLRPIKSNSFIDISTSNFYQKKDGRKRVAVSYNGDGIVRSNYKWLFLEKYRLRAGSFLIKKELVKKYRFDERLSRFEDMKCILQWVNNATIYASSTPVMTYNTDNCSLSRIGTNASRDYIFNMTFCGKGFWEKCQLGKLLYLGWVGYPNKRKFIVEKYWKYAGYAVVAKIKMLINHFAL